MAKAYLGKISALVTANTSDFNSKLNASAKEVRSFASAMQGSLSNAERAASSSLRGIYTESQKVSRALQAVASQRLSFKGFDSSTFASLGQAVEQFKRIQAASVNVNEPLARAARTIEGLSASVQLGFDPALKSAQKSAEYLSAALERGGIVGEKSFDRIQRKAVAAAEAADRLAEASQLAASGPRGTELAFAAPRVRDSLTASAAIRQQAANAPAAVLEGGGIARDVQKLVTIDNLIAKRRAEVEAGIVLNVDTSKAQRSLENLLAVSDKVRGRIGEALNSDGAKQRTVDNEIALLQRREQAAKSIEQQKVASEKRATENEIALIQRREQASKEAEQRRAADRQKANDNEIALLQRKEQAAKAFEQQVIADQKRAADNEIALIQRREQAAKEAEQLSAAGQKRSADNEIALIQRREQAAKEAEQLSAAGQKRSADNEIALLQRREQAAKELEQRLIAGQQRVENNELASLQRREQAAKEVEQRRQAEQQRAESNEIALLQRRERAGLEGEQRRAAERQRVAENEIALLQRREQAGLQSEQRRIAEQQRATDNEIALLQRREQAGLEAEQRRVAVQQRAADNEIALIQRREQAGREAEQRRLADQQRAADNEIALLQLRERAARDLERARADEGRTSNFRPFDGIERQARAAVGGDIPNVGTRVGAALDVGRQVDNIGERIRATRQQIDSLPEGVRAGLIPALQQAINNFVELSRLGAGATADQLARANREAERLALNTANVRRGQAFGEQFGGPGRRGLEFGLQEVSLRGYTAQLQVLQQTLAGASTTARGPALNAFNRLRAAISEATARGTLDVRATRNEIQRLTTDAVNAAAAARGIAPGGLGRQLQRAGDIGRGAFGNIGLGVQQAIFAIDDFFSVTGGLDQRIRAAGNNLSQLGYILGGTGGLIAGVAASITAQLIVAYINWQNAGVGTEDRLKTLNDAITRQKSLVESLAEAFASLADEIGRVGFSKQGSDAAQFAKQLDDIRKKQKELVVEQAAQFDPEVQQQRGIVAARERSLQTAQDPGERVRLNLDIQEARRRERERLAEIESRGSLPAAQAFENAARARFAVDVEAGRDEQAAFERQQADIAAGANNMRGRTAEEQFQIANTRIRQEQERLREEIQQNTGVGGVESEANVERRRQLANLEADRIRLVESNRSRVANVLEVEVVEASRRAAQQIGKAQEDVARAIESGVLGAVGFQSELDSLTKRLQDAQNALNEAQKRARETGRGGDLGTAEKARDEVAAIQNEINAREQEVAAIDAARNSLERFKDALDRVAQEADQNLQSAQRRADEARANDLGRGTDRTTDDRRRAEADLEDQRQARNRVDQEVAVARERARQNPATRDIESQIADINELLQYESSLPARQREELVAERARLQRQADENVRQQVENDPRVRAARDDSTRIEQQQQSADRGDALRRTPAQRAADDLVGQLADIRQSFGREAEQGSGLVDYAGQREAQRRAVEDSMRSVAPAVMDMRDERRNALLQGPSRAALSAADVRTTAGNSELNRLIKGDDAARNVDMVELQRQANNILQGILDAQSDAGIQVVEIAG